MSEELDSLVTKPTNNHIACCKKNRFKKWRNCNFYDVTFKKKEVVDYSLPIPFAMKKKSKINCGSNW